ncbi:MAG: NTP transferase domain-containing protein [bacterium]|nr:NTP transferase domain-containing protein [bacterium]
MKAVIMAGGEGTRLRPLTLTKPKPMVSLCNRPVLEYVLDLLKRHGIDTAIITLHYLAEDIVSYFGDGSDFGMKIIYSIEDEPLGTAGSVKNIEEYLDDTFLVLSGDALTDIDLGRVLAFHRENEAKATLTLFRVDNPLEYGVVITDDAGNIVRFLEKPSWGEVFSDQVNTGIYVLEPDVFDLMEPGKAYDFSKDIFPRLLEDKKKLMGYVASGYWCDIGDLEHFRKAYQDMFQGHVLHEMKGVERSPGVWIGEGTKIDTGVKLVPPLMIGRNCRIHSGVSIGQYSCIGDNCIIEENVELNRDILSANVFFGRNSRSSNSLISRKCTIKSGVVIGDGAVIGENVYVGRGAVISPQIKIWPDKHIEDGAQVSMNLVWGRLAASSIFGRDCVYGLGNIEITPEFAMKLGASYGSLLPKGAMVAVSRDAHPATRLVNRALISGLTSVGVNVRDLRLNPAPVSRYAVKEGKAIGGIHTRISHDDARVVEMEFFDERGINIDKPKERKIENLFVRQDYRRTFLDEVGIISFDERAQERYSESFISKLDVESIRKAGFKAVVDYSYGNASMILPSILNTLGVETVNINAYSDAAKARTTNAEHVQAVQQLSDIVPPVHAHLGVMIDADGEYMSLADEKGNIIENNTLLAFIALMVFRQSKDTLAAVPVNASHILEDIASANSGKIIRTRTDSRSIMHTAAMGKRRIAFAGTAVGSFIFPEFSPGFDAMFAFAKVLEMMAHENKPLSELTAMIPEHHLIYGCSDCSWSAKAKVMRMLVEQYRNRPIEMLDGVRVESQDGSVLIIPHPTLARINIWVEAVSDARAQEMLEETRRILKRMEKSEDALMTMTHAQTSPKGTNDILPEERAFHFWVPGRYLGIQARSLRTFVDVLHYVEASSLEYHIGRGDFASWFESELGRPLVARDLRQIAESGVKGELLRVRLLECFSDYDADSTKD